MSRASLLNMSRLGIPFDVKPENVDALALDIRNRTWGVGEIELPAEVSKTIKGYIRLGLPNYLTRPNYSAGNTAGGRVLGENGLGTEDCRATIPLELKRNQPTASIELSTFSDRDQLWLYRSPGNSPPKIIGIGWHYIAPDASWGIVSAGDDSCVLRYLRPIQEYIRTHSGRTN